METKLSPLLELKFFELVKTCLPLESICRCLSIDQKDFKYWEKLSQEQPNSKYGQFFAKIRIVEVHTRDKLVDKIRKSKSKKANKWLDENGYKKE